VDFSYKKSTKEITKRNSITTINKRYESSLKYLHLLDNPNIIIVYIDESALNESLIPLYGYSKKGEPFIVQYPPKSERISLIAAITKNEIIGF